MAGADKNTRRIDPGRSSHQPAKSVDKTAGGKATVKKSQAEEDAEWGYEDSRAGMAIEAKLGGMIVVVLLCAFAFLVYTKFDRKQKQLLATKSHEADETVPTENGSTGSGEELAAAESSTFSEFYPKDSAGADSSVSTTEPSEPQFADLEPTSFAEPKASSSDEVYEPGDAFVRNSPRTFGPEQPVEEKKSAVLETTVAEATPDFAADPFDEMIADTPPLQTEVSVAQTPPPNTVAAFEPKPLFDESSTTRESVAKLEGANSLFADEPEFASTPANANAPNTAEATEEPDQKLADLLQEFDASSKPADTKVGEPMAKEPVEPPLFADFEPTKEQSLPDFTATDSPAEKVATVTPEEPSVDAAFPKSPQSTQDSDPFTRDTFPAKPEAVVDNSPTDDVPLLDEAFPEKAQQPASTQPDTRTLIAMADQENSVGGLFSDAPSTPKQPAAIKRESPALTQPQPTPTLKESPTTKVAQQSSLFDGWPADEEVPLPNDPADRKPSPPLTLPTIPQPNLQPLKNASSTPQTQAKENYGVAHFVEGTGIQQVAAKEVPTQICTVEEKDTYWTISKRYYGTVRYFSALALYNQHRIRDPRKLRPGMKVLLPEAEVLEQKYPEFFPENQRRSKNLTAPATGYFVLEDGSPAYRIGKNETLSGISLKHLGRASRWMEIYRLNRQILKDPNKLKPGSVIRLPEDAASVQMTP